MPVTTRGWGEGGCDRPRLPRPFLLPLWNGCRESPQGGMDGGLPTACYEGVNAQRLAWGHVGKAGGWKSRVRGQRSVRGPVSPGDSPSTSHPKKRTPGGRPVQAPPRSSPGVDEVLGKADVGWGPVMVIWRSDDPSVALAILICAPDICRISLILVPWRPIMQPISWKKGDAGAAWRESTAAWSVPRRKGSWGSRCLGPFPVPPGGGHASLLLLEDGSPPWEARDCRKSHQMKSLQSWRPHWAQCPLRA